MCDNLGVELRESALKCKNRMEMKPFLRNPDPLGRWVKAKILTLRRSGRFLTNAQAVLGVRMYRFDVFVSFLAAANWIRARPKLGNSSFPGLERN